MGNVDSAPACGTSERRGTRRRGGATGTAPTRAGATAAVVAALIGCDRPEPSSTTTASVAETTGAAARDADRALPSPNASATRPVALASAVASADAPPTSPGAPARAAEGAPRCKATSAMEPTHLFNHPTSLVGAVIDAEGLVAIAQKAGWGGPYVIYRFARDGSGLSVLAKFASQETRHVAIDGGSVYFSTREGGFYGGDDTLRRVPRGGGPIERVAERFGWLGGIHDGYAYGVNYDLRHGRESVNRVPLRGGAVETLSTRGAGRVHSNSAPVVYGDLAVDARGLFLVESGWGLAFLPLTGGAPVERPFDRSVPPAVRLASAPGWDTWAVAHDGDRDVLLGQTDRGRRMGVLDASGKVTHVEPMKHIYMRHAVADDQCVYYVRIDPSGVTWWSAIPAPPRGP